ncbi:MAG: tRNA preQ1(34) S-adenosylmethionine ribosyltransferase-isomerase QueA [Christensenellales bacterium]|jgi:S-adenosylmethionine:tRNA ribosyltransferase-isomerase
MLKRQDFYYDLPQNLIAQTPAEPRDSSRLLVYNRKTESVEHKRFRDIADYLNAGDVLVVNTTRVIMARLFAFNDKGRQFELLLLRRLNATQWETLIKPAKKAKIGDTLKVNDSLSLTVKEYVADGVRLIEFHFSGVFESLLEQAGIVPLPPYIKQKLEDKERYQTVYSLQEGSSAAPTAGLHFTPELLNKIEQKGCRIVKVLLHVGTATFRPVKAEDITEHKMHSEYYELSEEAAQSINTAKEQGRRVIAVGTTSVRVLESAGKSGRLRAQQGYTDIFIYPPYDFKIADALITNFHLPESTLIMLVSAFAGREKVLELYRHAVEENYRFFSFGDAMFIE